MRKKAGQAAKWAAALAWAAAIFVLSSSPTLPKGPEIPGLDKIMHGGAYAILAWLLFRALFAGNAAARARAWPLAVLLAFLYGIGDEMHQAFVPGRSTDMLDALANLAGALIAWAGHFWAFRRLRREAAGRR